MKYLKWNCPLGCGTSACHCFVPGCPATFETVEGPPIAEEESQQMPSDTQNPIPSPESGDRGIERGESGGNTSRESLPMPILPGLAFH
jgi:hypothetical protein